MLYVQHSKTKLVDFYIFLEMEWNTFVDDAKDMGTSIFETFSSAFNNAMGELLFTATTLTTSPT